MQSKPTSAHLHVLHVLLRHRHSAAQHITCHRCSCVPVPLVGQVAKDKLPSDAAALRHGRVREPGSASSGCTHCPPADCPRHCGSEGRRGDPCTCPVGHRRTGRTWAMLRQQQPASTTACAAAIAPKTCTAHTARPPTLALRGTAVFRTLAYSRCCASCLIQATSPRKGRLVRSVPKLASICGVERGVPKGQSAAAGEPRNSVQWAHHRSSYQEATSRRQQVRREADSGG